MFSSTEWSSKMGALGFSIYGFGHFLGRFFGFCAKLKNFGFSILVSVVICGFRCAISRSVSGKNEIGLSYLGPPLAQTRDLVVDS